MSITLNNFQLEKNYMLYMKTVLGDKITQNITIFDYRFLKVNYLC